MTAELAKQTYLQVYNHMDSLEGYLGETLAYLLGAILTNDVIILDLETTEDAKVCHIFMDAKIPEGAWKHIHLEGKCPRGGDEELREPHEGYIESKRLFKGAYLTPHAYKDTGPREFHPAPFLQSWVRTAQVE